MSTEPENRPKQIVVAPLVPLALAVTAGIVLDRYADPWGTSTYGAIALGAVVLILTWARRHERIW